MSDKDDLSVSRSTAAFKRPTPATPPAKPAATGTQVPKARVMELPHPGASPDTPQTPAPAAALAETKTGPVPVQVFLPSRFEFYGPEFQQCFVKPMTGFHQSKFYRAATEKKDLHTANALTTLIGFDAKELTIPDFFFVLYWLRLNCYTKTQLIHNGVCDNPQHLQDVREKKKDVKTLRSVHPINQTWLEQEDLDPDYLKGFEESVKELIATLDPLGYTLDAPRMRDTIELHDDLSSDEANADVITEMEFLADRAACLRLKAGPPNTLKERIQVVESLPVDTQDMLDEWRVRVSLYGVKESIKFKCPECGAEVENPVLISAHSFL